MAHFSIGQFCSVDCRKVLISVSPMQGAYPFLNAKTCSYLFQNLLLLMLTCPERYGYSLTRMNCSLIKGTS